MHSEYVILIAFPRQQCLRELASMLRYMHTACVVVSVAAKHLTRSEGIN
jgi:hypothetical protein